MTSLWTKSVQNKVDFECASGVFKKKIFVLLKHIVVKGTVTLTIALWNPFVILEIGFMLVIQNELQKADGLNGTSVWAVRHTLLPRIDNGLFCVQIRLVFVDSQCTVHVENKLLTTSWRGDRRRFAWRLERWTVRWGEAGTERVEDQTTGSLQTGFPISEPEARRRTTPAGPNHWAIAAPAGHRYAATLWTVNLCCFCHSKWE